MGKEKRKELPFTRERLEYCLREQKRIKLEVQTKTCRSYRHVENHVLCAGCTRRNGPCSFKSLRAFKVGANKKLVFGPYFPSAVGKDPLQAETHTTYKPSPPQKNARSHIIKYLKPTLSEIIAQDSCSVNQSFPIYRIFASGNNHYCDKCMTAIFNKHFMCARCSYEICPKCYTNQDWNNCLYSIKHTESSFLLFEKYTNETQEKLKLYMKTKDVGFDTPQTPLGSADTKILLTLLSPLVKITIKVLHYLLAHVSKKTWTEMVICCLTIKIDTGYAIISYEDLSLERFQEEWGKSRPVVITNSLTKSKLDWTPQYFAKKYGKEKIDIIDCADYEVHQTTVKEYFKAFSTPVKRKAYAKKLGTSEVLKVKDWPPTENIASKFPDLYKDFMNTVPAPEYTSSGGYYNLANRLPIELLPPDLGPKVFISYKTGKTNLHCDMADAVNIMHHASSSKSEPVAAIWHIFPADKAATLSAWLRKQHKKFLDWWHPIHSQSLFMDDGELKLLLKETKIRPWVIHQSPGDAVFIPAGCPHQVRNCQDAIKCAVDFLSPENLKWGASITNEFSELPKIDALQLKSTLLFTWKDLIENNQ
ncbi:hypothetical protein BY458DRAFT_537303 [Sporodiniella umbellata]|nr:hypothetical protein BY458DRAFT_537303 [Sporodiniella umbellata]